MDYFIGPKYQRKQCRHNDIWAFSLISPLPQFGGGGNRWHGPIIQLACNINTNKHEKLAKLSLVKFS